MTTMTQYSCEEAFRRLDDYLDRELASEEMHLVHEHLQGCEMCAREFSFEEQVLQEVRTKLSRIEMPPDLRSRLFQLLDEERNTAGGAP
jgi:anti-sigma factor (TIGR02949 family)